MIGIQVVILFVDLGVFNVPQISELVTAVYAIILSLAKAVWFLSPVAGGSTPLVNAKRPFCKQAKSEIRRRR
jgi:hypothetical protein